MSLGRLVRIGLSMSPRQAAEKAVRLVMRRLGSVVAGAVHRWRCPYAPFQPGASPRPRLGRLDFSTLLPVGADIRALAERVLGHRFDLLGSGWVTVAHGAVYPGFGAHRYGPGPAVDVAGWRQDIVTQLAPGCRKRALEVLGLIDDRTWSPIDWHVDFKSGYRWSPSAWGSGVPYGHRPGVDIKVPWELARLQHLAWLAEAYALADLGQPGFDPPERYRREFRHQVLDFLGSNPPGWGVNWRSAMDVAIRAANVLVAWDLFRSAGAVFDPAFEAELAAAMADHGRFVVSHCQDDVRHRGNHYLADMAGLAFIAAYLPVSQESEGWLRLAASELGGEIGRQFLADGANFEASTSYHRLSTELAIFAAALCSGVGPAENLPDLTRDILGLAAYFSADITKPGGDVVQVGDNDSGRFFKLVPRLRPGDPGLGERHLDHAGLMAAASGLFTLDGVPGAGGFEAQVARALAGGRDLRPLARPQVPAIIRPIAALPASRLERLRIRPPDENALDGLLPRAYGDFGLFIWTGPRAFVSVRCGSIGQKGRGGHAHNDQLAVEIEIDGLPWVRDPGSLVYTADLAARNRYRSALAHFVPRAGGLEPARLLAPFQLEDRAGAEALRFGPDFLGLHRGFPQPVYRRVEVAGGMIMIEDMTGGSMVDAATEVVERQVCSPTELAALWGLDLPFSPGYGEVEPEARLGR